MGDEAVKIARVFVEKMRGLGIEQALEVIALQSELVCRTADQTNEWRKVFNRKVALARAVPHNIRGWKK